MKHNRHNATDKQTVETDCTLGLPDYETCRISSHGGQLHDSPNDWHNDT